MIETGESYKFRNHLEATPVFEDQVVEHMVTGALAHRRVIQDAPGRDPEVRGAVERHVKAAATIAHPAFPRTFFTEVVHGHYCIVSELVEGESIEDLTRRKAFADKHVWAATALDLVKVLREFEELGIAFDRLEPQNIVIRRGVVRVTSCFPVGHLKPGTEPENVWLRRLVEARFGGVYVAEKGFPLRAGMRTLKNILYFMATGQSKRTVGKVIHDAREHEKETGKRPLSLLGLEQQMERIFLRLHGEDKNRPINNLSELAEALYPLAPDRKPPSARMPIAPRARAEAPPAAAAPPPVEPPVPEETPLPTIEMEEESRPAREETPLPVSEPEPAPEASKEEQEPDRERRQREEESSAGGSGYSGPSAIPMVGPGRERDDAEEDRSYLYPDRGSRTDLKKPKKSALAASREVLEEGTGAKAWMLRGVVFGGGILVLVVIAVAAIALFQSMRQPPPPTDPPVARFAALPQTITTRDVITLDGTPSLEASEREELSFTWNVPELPNTAYRIRPNRSRAAAQPEMQVFDPGTYTLELRVFDGRLVSETYSRQFTISSPR